jgi:hypothetical protein
LYGEGHWCVDVGGISNAGHRGSYAVIQARVAYSYVNERSGHATTSICCHVRACVGEAVSDLAQEIESAQEKSEFGSCLIKSTIALKIHGALDACTVLHVNYVLVYVNACGLWSSRCRLCVRDQYKRTMNFSSVARKLDGSPGVLDP